MKHILLSFRGKSCNHCKGKSMERALFCIKSPCSMIYVAESLGWELGPQCSLRKARFKMQRELWSQQNASIY